MRVTDPTTPSFKQVQEIQNRINGKLSEKFPGLQMQMQVHRINVSVVSGQDVPKTLDLGDILFEAESLLETSSIPASLQPVNKLNEIVD